MEADAHDNGAPEQPKMVSILAAMNRFVANYREMITESLNMIDAAVEETGQMPLVDITLDQAGMNDLEELCYAMDQDGLENTYGTIMDVLRAIRHLEPEKGGKNVQPVAPKHDLSDLTRLIQYPALLKTIDAMITQMEIVENDTARAGEEVSIELPYASADWLQDAEAFFGTTGKIATFQQLIRFRRMMLES